MILRRFMKHVTDQNWFAVGLDVIVVITGIFLGMQVTEWNEERKEADSVIIVNQKLIDDFEGIKTQAEFRVKSHKGIVGELQYLLKIVHGDTQTTIDEDRIKQVLVIAEFFYENPMSSAAFQTLISSGKMHLIPDEKTLQALMEYHLGLDEAAAGFAHQRKKMIEYQKDFKRHSGLNSNYDFQAVQIEGKYAERLAWYDLAAMKQDRNFVKSVEEFLLIQSHIMGDHNMNLINAEKVFLLLKKAQ